MIKIKFKKSIFKIFIIIFFSIIFFNSIICAIENTDKIEKIIECPLFNNLAKSKSNYVYSFSESITNLKKSPIFLKTSPIYTFKFDNDYPVSIFEVIPYIKGINNKIIYFLRNKSFLSILSNTTKNDEKFSFRVYLYGVKNDNNISFHIYDMKKINDKWSGLLDNLNIVAKINGKRINTKKQKWIKDFNRDNKYAAYAILADNVLNMPEFIIKTKAKRTRPGLGLTQFDEITITHNTGILYLKDICLKNNPSISIKDDISHKPGIDDNKYTIIPFNQNVINQKVIIKLLLSNKEEESFTIDLIPGQTIPIDNKYLNNK